MPVPQDATITIRFTGLLVFCFDRRHKICQIGVLSKTDHELRIRFVKKGPDPGIESEQTLAVSHAMARRTPDLWLDAEGDPTPTQRAEPFIAGMLTEPPTDPQDFRWLPDLEGKDFYDHALELRRDALRPILSVSIGLFYSAMLSSDLYRAYPVSSSGETKAPAAGCSLGHIAKYVGANIYLTHPNQALVLRAGRNGAELLRLRSEKGVTYEITLENGDTPQAPAGGDYHYYYDAIKLRPGEPKLIIEPYGLPTPEGIMSVCGPVGLSKSDSLLDE